MNLAFRLIDAHTLPAFALPKLVILVLLISGGVGVDSLGINYGQIANNLPTPDKVVGLVKGIGASKVKLYDADPKVLKAFAKTGIQFTVSLGNEYMSQMKDGKAALDWVKKNVECHLPDTNITCILIGNEVLTLNDSTLTSSVIPAMQNIHAALVALQLDSRVWVTTAHNLAILQTSYPPSAGAFRPDLGGCLAQILNFNAKTGSPFLINAYPYFAYKASPGQVSLDYVLGQGGQGQGQGQGGVVDPGSGLRYDNMLLAQVDAVYAAMGASFSKRVSVQVSETGWPSKGDPDEVGATPENAKKYNANIIKLIKQRQGKGSPMRPYCDLNIFIFALFNENMKPGPTSERNYGLFKPDGSPAYSLGFPAIQAVANTSSDGDTTPDTDAPTPTSTTSPSSTGYLSISFARESYPSGGLFLISALLLIKLLLL
ncbi:glucan endo-1,3-beta-glucosidase 11-like [Silene latifolia]|uniref:glucan endo-1,3-beta-glucosidase 11-like n=1 Tax=Silene latifolia TaxID=37657 RepID=UPI003D776FDC